METLLEFGNMRLEKDGKRAWVNFTRESHLNALNNEGVEQLNRLVMALREDPDIRVVVIRGQGRTFCTGIDLKELAADRIDMSYHERFEKALRILETMEKVVIVGMHGYCLGGALQLAMACDIRVSTAGLPDRFAGHSRIASSGSRHLALAALCWLGSCQEVNPGRGEYLR